MSDYLSTLRRHRRLAILRHLEACGDYSSNASILTDVLHGLGITSTHDQVITELSWLAEQGLVAVDDRGEFTLATVTPRGVEIALGRATHPEIQRPRPRP